MGLEQKEQVLSLFKILLPQYGQEQYFDLQKYMKKIIGSPT
jgi:hypothetical protein